MNISDEIMARAKAVGDLSLPDKVAAVVGSRPDGMSLGVLFNRLRNKEREEISSAVASLLDAGELRAVKKSHARNGTDVIILLPPVSS